MNSGILGQISFKLESQWGVAVIPTKSFEISPGNGIQTDNDKQYISPIKAQVEKNTESFIGARKHEGEFEMPFRPSNLGYFLKSAFGSVNSALATSESVVYDHTFSENATKPSLTIEQSIVDVVARFAGCIVTSVKFSCKAGEPLMVTFGISAKSRTSATAITASYETSIRPLNFADIGATGFKIGGSSITEVNSFELEYKNNIDFLHALGSNDAAFNAPKHSEVTGKLELFLDTNTSGFYTDYLNNTQRAVDLTFTGDAIGNASYYKLNLNVPKADLKTAEDPIREDYNLLTISFEALKDTSTSKQIGATLTNLLANYN